MTKEEFIKGCCMGGYSTKKQAEEYAKKKDIFEDKDFEEVYRLKESIIYSLTGNTTKRYKQSWRMGSDRNE